jgi:hypothetical protein
MVRTEKDKLIIEIPTSAPETTLYDLLKDIPHLIQCLQVVDTDFVDDRLPSSIYTLLDLYRSLLPSDELVVEKMIKNMNEKPHLVR